MEIDILDNMFKDMDFFFFGGGVGKDMDIEDVHVPKKKEYMYSIKNKSDLWYTSYCKFLYIVFHILRDK